MDSAEVGGIKLEAAKPATEETAPKEKAVKEKATEEEEKSMIKKKETSKTKESTPTMSRENSMEDILTCGICQVCYYMYICL